MKTIVAKEIQNMQRKLSAILAAMAKNALAAETALTALRAAAKEIESTTSLSFPELDAELSKIAAVVEAGASAADLPTAEPVARPVKARIPAVGRTPHNAEATGDITGPQRKVLNAIAWWLSAGHDQPTRAQVAAIAEYSPKSGGFNNLLGQLNTGGLILIPNAGRIMLTDAGQALVAIPLAVDTSELHQRIRNVLSAPQEKLFTAAVKSYPSPMMRADLATATGYAASSGGFNNLIGQLNTLEIFTIPSKGTIRAADWLFI